jgi:hypothetical protein
MFARFLPELGFSLRLALAFSIWNLLVLPLLPMYAQLVVSLASWGQGILGSHVHQVLFTDIYPHVKWLAKNHMQAPGESTSFHLLSYNLILYFSVLTATRRVPMWHRIFFLASGLPVLFFFHGVDLMLVVESKWQTYSQPQYYAFWDEFSLWFVMVKFYHSFSVMALKQTFPLLLFYIQWQGSLEWRTDASS